jgi:hypothetical protein
MVLAILRGALLDFLATGELDRTSRAVDQMLAEQCRSNASENRGQSP